MVSPTVEREAVAHLRTRLGLSERRACRIVGADRKTVRYRSCRPPEAELRQRLRDLANERRRFGHRRLFVLLRREKEVSGIDRICRLDREEGLAVPGARPSAHVPRSRSRRDPTPAGRLISSRISWPAAAGSAS